DVERFLRHEAIEARPPSVPYKLKKFVQRNRVAVFLMLFIPATILAILFNHIVGLYRIKAQCDRAVAAEHQSQENLQKLQQVAREWATSETLTGDPSRAEVAIQLAEAAHVPKMWTEIMHAQTDIDAGRYQAALSRLLPIAAENDRNGDEESRSA